MTELTPPSAATTPDGSEPHVEMRYVARHPILNMAGKVLGYELLFRQGPALGFGGDGTVATRSVLDDTLYFGINRLTGGLPAFINCSAESILERFVEVLPPARTVIEIDASLDFSRDLPAACRHLKSLGYTLALDNFVWDSLLEPMLQIADYIKIDCLSTTPEMRKELLGLFRHSPALPVAVRVETQEAHRLARQEGFTLFQGFYFCRPELIAHAKIPANRLIHLQILQYLYQDPLDLKKIAPLVKCDAALTWRLLRLVNSPALAIHQEINSIEAAILVIGENAFRRIATVAILSEMNSGKPPEILRMALVRARFCELVAPFIGLEPDELYLVGMLSLLPAMMHTAMESVIYQLPLRHEIRQALLGHETPERWPLSWLEHWEHGEWEQCDAMVSNAGHAPQHFIQCYHAALAWDGNTRETTS